MSFIDDVRADRGDLARVLKKHKGIRRTVEELYPDSAHFIYELLQNAEDTAAKEATFHLTTEFLAFEHNGRSFTESDVWAITDIGEGTKADDEDKIGRFGVGFKAVFAYTEKPRIWSPTFSFEISDLVLPNEIAARTDLAGKTRFEFPFNNPKKDSAAAYSEVMSGLQDLAETTLLFLSHLEAISWKVGERNLQIRRVEHSTNHVEVLKREQSQTISSSHFLRFSQPVSGIEKQRVAVAFALGSLPGVGNFDPGVAIAKQFRVVPAAPGRVAVFFPATKEASELRFHLHAPFVPELSRASIKDTPANAPLFELLAALCAASLHEIRNLDLLTVEFLGVLPTSQDELPPRYRGIRSAIIEEMNRSPLTPTLNRSHAPAKYLLQGKASLKDLLSSDDIEFLVEYDSERPEWAVSAPQRNSNADRLLSSLAIKKWDVSDFVSHMIEKASATSWRQPDKSFMDWLAAKSEEWHQQLYAFLYFELSSTNEWARLESLNIVRRDDGGYGIGKCTFFPSDDTKHDDLLPRVSELVYSSGRSKTQQEASKKFLEAIGVRLVGELEQVQAILDQRYRADQFSPSMKDVRKFVALVEKDSSHAKIFEKYHVLKRADEKWGQPSQVFIDAPFLDTGLNSYFASLGDMAKKVALSPEYVDGKVSVERISKFAAAVGAQTSLQLVLVSCTDNPQWPYLAQVGGERYSSHIDIDYTITDLGKLLSKPSMDLSRLVWKTMCALPRTSNWLDATFQKNARYGHRTADSQLVHMLRAHAWVPQRSGGFVAPADAVKDELPEGFAFDPGYLWLKRVRFGEGNQLRAEELAKREVVAKQLGFGDARTLERAKLFAALPKAEQESILADVSRRAQKPFPVHEPQNLERRSERVSAQARSAPERVTEERTRSVSVGRETVKVETEQYLREQYTNHDGELVCQICKGAMPFKLDDGSYYFEKVEFLGSLKRRHYQNYLALCPNHAAMFIEANSSERLMRDLFLKMESDELPVVLAQREMTVKFTKTHLADLRSVIAVEAS